MITTAKEFADALADLLADGQRDFPSCFCSELPLPPGIALADVQQALPHLRCSIVTHSTGERICRATDPRKRG